MKHFLALLFLVFAVQVICTGIHRTHENVVALSVDKTESLACSDKSVLDADSFMLLLSTQACGKFVSTGLQTIAFHLRAFNSRAQWIFQHHLLNLRIAIRNLSHLFYEQYLRYLCKYIPFMLFVVHPAIKCYVYGFRHIII